MATASAARALLALCVAGWCAGGCAGGSGAGAAGAEQAGAEQAGAERAGAERAGAAARWLQLLAGYAGEAADDAGWFPRPVPLSLPVGVDARGRPAAVPVLLLPVPVPAPTPAPSPAPGPAPAQCEAPVAGGYALGSPSPAEGHGGTDEKSPRPAGEAHAFLPRERPVPAHSPAHSPAPAPTPAPVSEEEPSVPHLDYVVSSQQLVELFRAQVAPNPELPPIAIPARASEGAAEEEEEEGEQEDEWEEPPPPPAGRRGKRLARVRGFQVGVAPPPPPFAYLQRAGGGGGDPASPPPPRFDRSLMLRGSLTVPRAGYTEPYTVWWDAESGSSRVDLHGGATSTYVSAAADGRVRALEVRTDRAGERAVRRCVTAAPRPAAPEDRVPPGLPDAQLFSYTGMVDGEFGVAERWAHTVRGAPGELGGARGEALTFHHELLVKRAPDNVTSTPLRYSVSVDSSVLGEACDGYVHRYSELRERRHDPALFVVDLVESCEEVAHAADGARDRVEPLREFTMRARDPRHDELYDRFKAAHARRYADDAEEAVRKNLMVQHTRFVGSGNRQGATCALEVNHLGDRLDAELRLLSGAREEGAAARGERFPHARAELAHARGRLPVRFDWRTRGAVTHVRNQGSCSSCWAFAVTGAVEGALFVRTRRLVPLSEQTLVDCAHAFGAHGCGGSWPSSAFEYVAARGLPALARYTPYREMVLQCAAASVPPVTHISSYVNVTAHSVTALKVAIRRHAPTVVIIDSSPKSFVFYKKGVIDDERCAKNKAEHAVLAVGWGARGEEDHFIVKNSWSAAWGDGGYARLAASRNTCGVLSRPSYPRLERPDVDQLPPA